eukprot:TRINITY_DN2911_c1_g1_i1.p1 TRINITY_DN2911_c1_g1~~TRINITY_DN2911_c1_g1_i1.p1  ORF type:complete len:405 (+),score=85.11 TRINITY_DN2911_c1_g1_i1:384-1598(+)
MEQLKYKKKVFFIAIKNVFFMSYRYNIIVLWLILLIVNGKSNFFNEETNFFTFKDDKEISDQCKFIDLKLSARLFSSQSSNAPSSFNWLNYLNEPSIISFTHCNAHYAMANVYASQLIYQKQFHTQEVFSVQSILSCIKDCSCQGGNPYLPWILSSVSSDVYKPYFYHREAELPYLGSDAVACPSEKLMTFKIKTSCWGMVGTSIDPLFGLKPIPSKDIFQALLEYGPLLTEIECDEFFLQNSAILTEMYCGVGMVGIHAFPAVIYGYERVDEENDSFFWLVQIFGTEYTQKYKVLMTNDGFGVGGIRSFVSTVSFDKAKCPPFNDYLMNHYNQCFTLFDDDIYPIVQNSNNSFQSIFYFFIFFIFVVLLALSICISCQDTSNKDSISMVNSTLLEDFEIVDSL